MNPNRRHLLHASVAGLTASAIPSRPMAAQTGKRDAAQTVAFAVIGDTPYGNADERNLRLILQQAARETSFTIHLGDLKGGSESCHDDLLAQRLSLLDQSPQPLFFVPGDNEWTDCHRLSNGSYDPVERLNRLRHLAFPNSSMHLGRGVMPAERGPTKPLIHQPGAQRDPELMRWQAGPCLFVTLNVPGTYNGLNGHISDRHNKQRAARNRYWLHESVDMANRLGLSGLVVALHGEIRMERFSDADFDVKPATPKMPYAPERAMLAMAAGRFNGKTLLLYGDRHQFGVDQPTRNYARAMTNSARWQQPLDAVRQRLRAFTSIQCFGWPFSAQYVIVKAWINKSQATGLSTLVATRSL